MPLSTPTLAVADNAATPTGAVVTVSGSDASSTNTVSTLQWTQPSQTPGAWVSRGSRTGDGTVSVALAKGYYWVKVDSVLGGQSACGGPAYTQVTDGLDAVLYRCLTAAQAVLQGMTFAGLAGASVARLPPANVVVKKTEQVRIEALPALLVYVDGAEQQKGPLTGLDDVWNPVGIDIIDRDDAEFMKNFSTYLLWRQQIFRAFRWQRLAGVPEVYLCEPRPKPVVSPRTAMYGVYWSALTLNFISREPRGIA